METVQIQTIDPSQLTKPKRIVVPIPADKENDQAFLDALYQGIAQVLRQLTIEGYWADGIWIVINDDPETQQIRRYGLEYEIGPKDHRGVRGVMTPPTKKKETER